MTLRNCIGSYVPASQLQQIAERASWLGNDGTHYDRVWGDKDLQDLSILLKPTVNRIDDELLSKHYFKDVQKKSK